MNDAALTEAELDRLTEILGKFPSPNALNLEALNGFIAALACSPEEVPPQECLPEVWGGEMTDEVLFANEDDMADFLELTSRHFMSVVERLNAAEPFTMILLGTESGEITGNDWAQGFVRGMRLSNDAWAELIEDGEIRLLLIPFLALAHEHNPDPEMRLLKEPVDAEQRKPSRGSCCSKVPPPRFRSSSNISDRWSRSSPKTWRLGRTKTRRPIAARRRRSGATSRVHAAPARNTSAPAAAMGRDGPGAAAPGASGLPFGDSVVGRAHAPAPITPPLSPERATADNLK